MKTAKSISNVGYWGCELAKKMFAQIASAKDSIAPQIIWINHKGEDGDKDHYHLLLLAGHTRDTQRLDNLLQVKTDNATGCQVGGWRVSKSVSEWLLYSVHHPAYLMRKGEQRENSYPWEGVLLTDKDGTRPLISEDWGKRLIIEAKRTLDHLPPCNGGSLQRAIRYYVQQGIPFRRMVMDGIIPIPYINTARQAYADIYAVLREGTENNLSQTV